MRIALVLVAALVLLAGCGIGSAADATPKPPDREGRLVFLDSAPNTDLDPASVVNDSSFAQAVLYAIYDRLLGFDPKGDLTPGLATRWGFVDPSLRTFELTLRPGVRFHDGTPLDAAAVTANLRRSVALGSKAGPTVAGAVRNVAAVTTVDPRRVRVTLKAADGGFAYNLASQLGMMISPRALTGTSGPTLSPIGTGPYRVVDFKPGRTTVLTRNDDFWAGLGNRPRTFEIRYVPDDQTRVSAVRSGQADIAILTPRQLAAAKSLSTVTFDTLSMWDLYLNTSRALRDVRVRQALMYAINRNALVKGLTFNTGKPAFDLFPPGYPVSDPGAPATYAYDPAKARQLLAAAGHPDGLTLDYIQLNTPEYAQITEALQQQFAEVGIRLNISVLDIAQFGVFSRGEKGDLVLGRWGGRADPLSTLRIVLGQGGTYAPGGAVTPRLTELLNRTLAVPEGDPGRTRLVAQANAEAVDQAATVPVMTRGNIYAFEPGCVQGLGQYLASGSNDWRDVTVGTGC